MKNLKITLVAIALLCNNLIHAATIKVLFDATRAETANNADWVLDSDNFNLSYSSGPAKTGGSEGNAQRIPTPAQSGINSSTSESYWQGALSAWGVDCAKKGYQVETLPYNGQITYGNSSNSQDLSNYQIYIVCEPNISFTASEKTAILNFIKNGGGLFMISDHDNSDRNGDGVDSPTIWNDLMSTNTVQTNPFGITFDLVSFSQTTSNIASLPQDSILHGSFGNVTQVMWSSGTSMTINKAANSSVVAQIFKTGSSTTGTTNVMFATARFGKGKVAAIGDSSPCDDGTGDTGDSLYDGYIVDASGNHQKLLMNATIWLATPSITTGINAAREEKKEMQILSNPVSDGVVKFRYRDFGAKNSSIELIDASGRVITSRNSNEISTSKQIGSLNVSSIKPGWYILRVTTNHISTSKPLIIQ